MTKPNYTLCRSWRWPLLAVAFVAWCQLLAWQASADEAHPLQPIDTSSPRATLQGFLETTNEGYAASSRLRQSYWSSSRLYFLPEEIATMRYALSRVESAERTLDLSELPSATISESSRRLVVQLKEILDRIEHPPLESVPDEQAMAKVEFKRWTLPGTEIRIARIEQGPRTGEYLFTPETVSRIPEFYLKAKNLPYKPGASIGWYDLIMNSPTGVVIALHSLVPPRWVFSAAVGMQATFLDQPLWRWVSIAAVLATGWAVIVLCHHLSRRWAVGQWTHLLLPLGMALVASTMVSILAEVLRVSGFVYHAVTLLLWTVFYLALTWAAWMAGSVVAESVIAHEKLRASSIDSQLIRLALRLLTIVLAIAILVTGADRVGLPAYSVIAGLGVGGLAVALAAQQTLANLLGSIIIMIEKPFAIGHWIKVKDIEGIVEDIGFRSTRLRTFYDSMVTIPSSQMVTSTVDNMELRQFRQMFTRWHKRLAVLMLGFAIELVGCSALRFKNEPLAHWNPDAGYRAVRQISGHRSGELLLIVAFSGGGTRAAAFSYGVLEELRDTQVSINGQQRRLLDEIDLISGVSGGSFPAAYYGLYGDSIFSEFEPRFLKKNIEGVLVARLLRPINWVRLFSPYFGRGELAAEYYDEELFHGATFGDLIRRDGPYIGINATDLSSGSRFTFTQDFFDLVCSDLSKFPVSVAVTASSAVPVLFSPITLQNYAGSCGYELSPWAKEALTSPAASVRRRAYARQGLSFLDAKHRRYIHLLDGGISDNLGIRTAYERLVLEGSNLGKVLKGAGHGNVHNIVFIVVNSQTEPQYNWDVSEISPALPDILGAVTSVQINRYNFETIDLVKAAFDQWTRNLSTADHPVAFQMIEVSFDDEKDEQQRRFFHNLPTSFSLEEEDVDKLKAAGRQLLKANPEFQSLVRKLSAGSTDGSDAQ